MPRQPLLTQPPRQDVRSRFELARYCAVQYIAFVRNYKLKAIGKGIDNVLDGEAVPQMLTRVIAPKVGQQALLQHTGRWVAR
jgi:hypothetical protein